VVFGDLVAELMDSGRHVEEGQFFRMVTDFLVLGCTEVRNLEPLLDENY